MKNKKNMLVRQGDVASHVKAVSGLKDVFSSHRDTFTNLLLCSISHARSRVIVYSLLPQIVVHSSNSGTIHT